MKEFEKGSVKADFEEAIQSCDGACMEDIEYWLDTRENGETWSLRARLFE